jgi:hypothetical protein
MKNLLLIAALFLTFAGSGLTQDHGRNEGPSGRRAPMKKIEELEKVKLLDVLNLDEGVAAKLITRRNQDRSRIWDIEDKINDVLDKIKSELKGKDKDVTKIQKLNESYMNLTMDVEKEKLNFLRSLSDILTPEQVGKFIVFERKFREDIRDLLMKERMKRDRNK